MRRRLGSALAGEREYAFKHALTREVAYGSLPRAARSSARGARRLVGAEPDGGQEQAAMLAHHYAEAVRPEDADLAWAGDPAS